MSANKARRRQKIRSRIRSKIKGTSSRPRMSIFRSNKQIYAQLINDETGHTLISASSRELSDSDQKLPKSASSKLVGTNLAKRAKEMGIERVVFDRGGYLYHGRVKALAEGSREAGLIF